MVAASPRSRPSRSNYPVLELLRLLAVVGTAANWTAIFITAIIAIFMCYIGIAMCATLSAGQTTGPPVIF